METRQPDWYFFCESQIDLESQFVQITREIQELVFGVQ